MSQQKRRRRTDSAIGGGGHGHSNNNNSLLSSSTSSSTSSASGGDGVTGGGTDDTSCGAEPPPPPTTNDDDILHSDLLLTPKRAPLVGSATELNTPTKAEVEGTAASASRGGGGNCTPHRSPIKGLPFSPSQFLNSPVFLDGKTLTSTPVFRRLQQRDNSTPSCGTKHHADVAG